ncbi:MAG: carboxypeptidase regulatory-like domain-containing protein [Chloracidobacterium sp.]|nr:carboxypeptidase regulatory-like domain-containing protein [Chloracidobacterium sp.]
MTDLDFGARRDGLPGKCLYFTDDFNDVIYSACGFAPTAANVSVSGRVFSPDGFGLRNASVSITDTRGSVRSTLTGSFGYFRFDEIVAGESYVVAVRSKRYVFTTRVINPYEELTGVDFTPE